MSEKISKILFPRLVVLITTCGMDGKANVSTFSFIMPISFQPKYVAFAVVPTRYTFKNLKEVPEFVINIPNEKMLKEVWVCGTRSGRDTDKFKLAELKTEASVKVKPLRIEKCPIQLECKVEFMREFGDHYLIVGKVLEEHVKEKEFKPILHHSGNEFYVVGEKVSYGG